MDELAASVSPSISTGTFLRRWWLTQYGESHSSAYPHDSQSAAVIEITVPDCWESKAIKHCRF